MNAKDPAAQPTAPEGNPAPGLEPDPPLPDLASKDPASGAGPTQAKPAHTLPLGRKLLYSCVMALLCLGMLEGGLRLLFPVVRTASMPETDIRLHLDRKALAYDPDLYWYWIRIPDGGVPLNEYGFRRTWPMSLKKPKGMLRVITTGDSQTMGAGLEAHGTYSAHAEKALGPGWEVLNAGISGYRSLNVYRLLQKRLGFFEPDVVVVDCMPFDSPRDDGPLVGPKVRTGTQKLRALLFESATYHTMELLLDKLRPNRPRWLDEQVPNPRIREEGLGNHDLIVKWGEQYGVQIVFMEYPVMNEHRNEIGCHTLPGELPEGIPVAPTCQALIAAWKSGIQARELFQDHNHLTALGSKVVGEALAQTLKSLEPALRR